tara:strand:+ start:1471 stop:2397 length:927 start_codon:yes stop_codon:yes gene_type:complete
MSELTNDNNGKKTIIKKVKKKKVSELTKSIDNNKRLKTPLRYAGGKSKAIYKLEKHLPEKMFSNMEIHDCFLGGGSFPLYLTKLYPNLKVRVNDIYFPLYNFWIQLRDNGNELSEKLLEIKKQNNSPELARVLFDNQKKVIEDTTTTDFDKGVAFYILNKCSFSGLVSSSFSSQASVSNFGESGINNLKIYSKLIKSWDIYNLDYKEFTEKFSNKENVFLYLDPPYMIKDNLYGDHGELHKVFKHEEFFKVCPKLKCKQLISYNSDLLIKNAFVGYKISDYDLTYTLRSTGTYMEDQKSRKELAMKNY